MQTIKMPVFFISYGGGPWPYVDGMPEQFAITEAALNKLPLNLPTKPKAILVITGHWEANKFTVPTAENPPMEYDYSGFPEHTYHIQYPAKGSPALAHRVRELLSIMDIASAEDATRGFDHGAFVPLMLMYPNADIPVVLLSMKSNYNPIEHIKLGKALAPLRDEGVLMIGSGLTYHNMRGFGQASARVASVAFEQYLNDAITNVNPTLRNEKLIAWQQAPYARVTHPREDHLIPLMVIAAAAKESIGRRLFVEEAFGVVMASYVFEPSVTS